MSALKLNIPHKLAKEEAIARIKNLLGNLKEEHKDNFSNLKEKWEGGNANFSFTAKGFDLAGNIIVNDSNVEINSKLPFAVSLFKGMIEEMITRQAKALLA